MDNISQNLHDYLPATTTSIKHEPASLKADYLAHYFSPWTNQNRIMSDDEIKQILLDVVDHYTKHPGYALTRKQHNDQWIKEISQNADLTNLPNINKPGIALFDTEVRLLPTQSPTFKDINSQWDSYPFDDMQQSYLTAGTPLNILHISKNHAWMLILTDGFFGWVNSQTIAFVSNKFMSIYQSNEYVVPLEDTTVSFDDVKQLPVSLRIGSIYPLKETLSDSYMIYSASVDNNRNAVLKTVELPKQTLSPFPLPLSLKNIADIGNHMMGNPYGWGGLCGYRDCSSTLADLFSTFAIWLPRNSKAQIEAGPVVSLHNMDNTNKLKIISEESMEFMSILYTPGHVMLYLAEKDNVPYIYQSASRCYGTVITPLDFQLKEERNKTLLEEVTALRVLTISN